MREYDLIEFEKQPAKEYLWIIEAPFEILDRFCRIAGLERDSAIPLVFSLKPDRFADARLTCPSAKCSRPEAWLHVMALLYVHHVSFKLYQAIGRQGAITSITLLRPSIDKELEGLLGLAAQGKIAQLRDYTKLLQWVFKRLEDAAIIEPEY